MGDKMTQNATAGSLSATSSTEITISYEVLYDILRSEKTQFQLQKLHPSFFSQVLRYLENQLLQIQQSKYKTDLFSSTQRSKAEMQMHNAKRILREIYEKRERKIIDMALNKSKTNVAIIDTESLLEEERAFFEALVILFNRYREGVLNNIFQLKHPLIAMANHTSAAHIADDFEEAKHPHEIDKAFREDNAEDQEGKTLEKRDSKEDNTPPHDHSSNFQKRKTIFSEMQERDKVVEYDDTQQQNQEEQSSISKSSIISSNNNKSVTFIKSVERFVDEDLKYHGPFSVGQTAEIPNAVADILIEQGKAKSE